MRYPQKTTGLKQLFLFASLFVLGSCAKKTSTDPNLSSPDMGMAHYTQFGEAENETDKLLSRVKGQREFLTPTPWYSGGLNKSRAANGAESADAGNAREVQESDVYKIGAEGSKLLYLLNSYRGLQTINFEDGVDGARLESRVPIQGSWGTEMFFQKNQNRLISIQREDSDQNPGTLLVVYDLTDPKKPVETQSLRLEGWMKDRRLVGDVIYIGTMTSNWDPQTRVYSSAGYVYSVDLTGEIIEIAQKHALTLPFSYGQNSINIIQNDDSYYLAAATYDPNAGWWNRQSTVELLDITDPQGEIKPIFTVEARGRINERSWMNVRDKTLITVSNYVAQAKTADGRSIGRVAVEVFKFPTKNQETIDSEELGFRKYQIKKALDKYSASLNPSLDALERELLIAKEKSRLESNEDFGLKGVLLKRENTVTQLLPDFSNTQGDTTGQSALLQDVRVEGDLLYAFWVPANNIDPLDVFDISNPNQGIDWLLRHQPKEGFVQWSQPFTYKEKQYILALGQVIPSEDNELGLRHPQAFLFKVLTDEDGDLSVKGMSTLALKEGRIWVNLNREDKYIHTEFNEDGTGEILFEAHRRKDGEYSSGGQVIRFDMEKALAKETRDDTFSEGGFLEAKEGYLSRVFDNPEIDAINVFSAQALGSYERSAEGRFDRVSKFLELARNIQSYAVLKNDKMQRGVQVVSSWSWYASTENKTELRFVDPKKADSEKPGVLKTVELRGSYENHLLTKTGDTLVVLTRGPTEVIRDGEKVRYVENRYLSRVSLVDETIAYDESSDTIWIQPKEREEEVDENGNPIWPRNWGQDYMELDDGRVVVVYGADVFIADLSGETLQLSPIEVGVELNPSARVSLKKLGNRYFLFSQEQVDDPNRPALKHFKNQLLSLLLEGNKVTVEQKISIPGEPIALAANRLVTRDSILLDLKVETEEYIDGDGNKKTRYEYTPVVETALVSLDFTGFEASLLDLEHTSGNAVDSRSFVWIGDNKFVSLPTIQQSPFDFRFHGGLIEPGFSSGRGRIFHGGGSPASVDLLKLNEEGDFVKQSRVYENPEGKTLDRPQVLKVLERDEETLLVLGNNRDLQVLSVGKENFALDFKKLERIDHHFNSVDSGTNVRLPRYVYNLWGGKEAVVFDENLDHLIVPQDLYGVTQVVIKD